MPSGLGKAAGARRAVAKDLSGPRGESKWTGKFAGLTSAQCAFSESVPINDYVTGKVATLAFENAFPAWLWTNAVTRDLFRWCREWNASAGSIVVEVVGMDLYRPSRDALTVQQVMDAGLYTDRPKYLSALAAESFQRYEASANSWNVRDEHMFRAIEYLLMTNDCRVIVFAHNSHCLDYRATDHHARGELSVGQLCRENFDAYIVAQSTFSGTVRAAAEWGGPDREWELERPASSSLSHVLHAVEMKEFVLDLDSELEVRRVFNVPHSSRAIGVVYKQGQEGLSHYFEAVHSLACHAIIHIDHSTALRV